MTFLFALAALITAILNRVGKSNLPPLWIAVALLAFGVVLPWSIGMLMR